IEFAKIEQRLGEGDELRFALLAAARLGAEGLDRVDGADVFDKVGRKLSAVFHGVLRAVSGSFVVQHDRRQEHRCDNGCRGSQLNVVQPEYAEQPNYYYGVNDRRCNRTAYSFAQLGGVVHASEYFTSATSFKESHRQAEHMPHIAAHEGQIQATP